RRDRADPRPRRPAGRRQRDAGDRGRRHPRARSARAGAGGAGRADRGRAEGRALGRGRRHGRRPRRGDRAAGRHRHQHGHGAHPRRQSRGAAARRHVRTRRDPRAGARRAGGAPRGAPARRRRRGQPGRGGAGRRHRRAQDAPARRRDRRRSRSGRPRRRRARDRRRRLRPARRHQGGDREVIGRWVFAHGRGVGLAMALIVAAGLFAYLALPRGLYPELSFPRIAVVATLPDATSEIVLRNVTRPLEEALMPVLGVKRVRSKTIRGATEISVLFEPESDMVVALQLVQARLAEVRGELPGDASVVAERITPTSFPVYTVNVDGNVPPTQLRDLAMFQLRPALSRVRGVGPVTVTAGLEREVEVIVDPARAEAAGLDVDEIARKVGEANRYATVGRLDRAYRRYAILLRGNAADLSQLGE